MLKWRIRALDYDSNSIGRMINFDWSNDKIKDKDNDNQENAAVINKYSSTHTQTLLSTLHKHVFDRDPHSPYTGRC